MSNDLVPPEQSSSFLTQFLQDLNLPPMIAVPAGRAISRLITGFLDVPMAHIERFTAEIGGKAEARELDSREVAVAASKLAASDPNIISRAAYNLLVKEYKYQSNKENVAKMTVEILIDESAKEAAGDSDRPSTDVNEDWLNVFEKYAQEANSERMQRLWARTLAGEIRQPKSFSLKTLRFVAELDQATAALFEKYLPFAYGSVLPIPPDASGQQLAELFQLQDDGLISGAGGALHNQFNIGASGFAIIRNQGRSILLRGEPNKTVTHSAVMLTKTGTEIAKILSLPFRIDAAERLVELLPKNHLTSVALGNLVPKNGGFKFEEQKVIWQRD